MISAKVAKERSRMIAQPNAPALPSDELCNKCGKAVGAMALAMANARIVAGSKELGHLCINCLDKVRERE